MALEQTYNKEAKTQLFKGIIQKQSARKKYQWALSVLTAVSEQTRAMVHVSEGTCTPRRPTKTQASKDRDAVNNIKMLLVGGLINSFTLSSSDLLNITTGEKCASLDLLEAKEKGQEALSKAEETLNTTVTPVCLQIFHEKPVKSLKAKSVKSLKVKSLKAKIYQEESNVVRSLHFLRDIDSESFRHEWIKYPASLFEPDDQCYVTRKADYVVAMKSQLGDSWVDHLPPNDGNVLMVDAMAFIHRQQDTRCKKFLNMATRYLRK